MTPLERKFAELIGTILGKRWFSKKYGKQQPKNLPPYGGIYGYLKKNE